MARSEPMTLNAAPGTGSPLDSSTGATVFAAAGGPLIVPSDNLIVEADYVRQGPDLKLVGPDGAEVLIVGYFATETPADLVNATGARIPGDLAAKLAGPAAPSQYAQAGQDAGAEAIGTVENL